MYDSTRMMFAATAMAAAGLAALGYVNTLRIERAARQQIDTDHQFDIEAIKRAKAKMIARIIAGDYDGRLHEVVADTRTHIEFEKIAIRNEK